MPCESQGLRLALFSALALFVFRLVDAGLYRLAAPRWPTLALLPDLRISSLALLAVAFAASPLEVKMWSRPPDARTWKLGGIWLAATFAVVRFTGVGKVALPRWQDQAAHVFTGAIAEELLCRGLVLGTALAIWPVGWKPVAWSAVVFAAMHLQYHAFHLDSLALTQVVWTLPMGVVFAAVVTRTRSLGVAMLLHIANNAIVLLA